MTTKENDVRPGIPVRDEVTTPPSAGALSRRTALQAFSAAAFFALTGCGARKPERKIVSLAETPEYQKPGKALWYASAYTDGHWPYGIQVKCLEGRPVKIEGLPGHPLNDGTSDVRMQATLTSLYDPDRLRNPKRGAEDLTWAQADEEIAAKLGSASSALLLTGAALGPSQRRLVERFTKARPGFRHLVVDTLSDAGRRQSWATIYGGDGVLVPDLAKAKVVFSLGSDFLGTDGPALLQTAGYAARRRVDGDPQAKDLSRLWVAESAMTTTGSSADHRIPVKPSNMTVLVEAIRKAVDGDPSALAGAAAHLGTETRVLAALADDLRSHRGEAVALAGPEQTGVIHASVALLNESLGARGTTLRWNPEPATLQASTPQDVRAALEQGPDVVILLGVNPVHDFPGGGFADLLAKAKTSIGHGLIFDETLSICTYALPSTHGLESWNDTRPAPGMTGIVQPTIAPLFDGRQDAHSLYLWTKALDAGSEDEGILDWHDVVKQTVALDGTAWWDALRTGLVGEVAWATLPAVDRARVERSTSASPAAQESLLAVVVPHPYVLDGRFTSMAWLLELPDPVSRLVWDNAAQIGPATAAKLGLAENDVVRLTVGEHSIEVPVLVQTGTAPDTVVLPLGFGRAAGAGSGVGVNVAPLLRENTLRVLGGLKVEKTGRTHELVRMQRTFDQHDRPIAREGTADEYRAQPDFAQHQVHVPELVQLHDEYDYTQTHKWAMAIDLNACIGCSACTIACQSENNIPVVGKAECATGREMSWIRIDRYEDPALPDNPSVLQQPMLCQHCDNAPCENVCPVNATAHSPEGLNEQVYNRCVGTRYCANNCPYKVRRFNYLAYTENALEDPAQDLLSNPGVTVRSRGVMEKCSFCVQRINEAKYEAANAGVELEDGAAVPACQQACPAEAIVFGDLNKEGSAISKKRASPLGYHVLEELNVRPNVTYLAKVRNPHPSLVEDSAEHAGGHR